MADFKAKAEAIWAALDQMAEKNPETYKQFINDQLNGDGAQDMLAQLKLGDGVFGGGSGGKPGGLGGAGGGSSSAQSSGGRYGGGGGGGSGGGGGKCKGNKGGEEPDPVQSYRASIPSKKRSFLTTSNGRMGATTSTTGTGSGAGTGTNSKNNNGPSTSTSSVSSPAPNNSLLDDAFSHSTLLMNPFLAQIIADDEEDDDLLLTELKMRKEGGGDGHVQAQPQSQISHQNDEVKDKSSKDIKKPGKKKLIEEL